MGKLFGTDGVRGITNQEPMTSEIALKVGQAVAHLARKDGGHTRVVVGKDTRLSGYMLESALVSGLTSMGADVILVGPMPTPGIDFIAENMDAECGIVISASHNPFEDNGIKIFFVGEGKLTDEKEAEIEELVFSDKLNDLLCPPGKIGKVLKEEDARGRYIVFLKHTFPRHENLEGLKVVLDCANGATYRVAPTLFTEMRAETISINTSPDGMNINHNCGALHPEELAETVVREKADIGFAFDGDGDRLIAVDETGAVLTGDKMLAICAKHMKKKGELNNNLVVSTVMSNLGLSKAFNEMGIKNIQAKVGDRYVREEMVKNGAVLGGEDSGHIIFLDKHNSGDGILTALQLLAVMKAEGKSLSALGSCMKIFPQIIINVDVKEKPELNDIPEIKDAIDVAEKELADKGRILVRYSGTQNMCRVMVEGPTADETKALAQKIATIVSEKLK